MNQVISVFVVVVVILSGTSFAASEKRASGTVYGRIIGGSDATIENYPFMLRLYVVTTTGAETRCGASVIGEFYALTAAHCFYGKTVNAYYFLGGSTFQSAGGSIFNGESYTVHPGYNPYTYNNDVAVVKITISFFSNPLVKTIPLQNTEPAASTSCYALGWGRTTPTGSPSDILQLGNYKLRPTAFCDRVWGFGQQTPQMYCGTAPQGRICFGDSGGPLVCGGRLHGIVSFGGLACQADYAEAFVKVPSDSIRNFIREVSGI